VQKHQDRETPFHREIAAIGSPEGAWAFLLLMNNLRQRLVVPAGLMIIAELFIGDYLYFHLSSNPKQIAV